MSAANLDAQALRAALIHEIEQAWVALTALAVNEPIYSFALYTSGEWSYLLATGNTEEGLARTVVRYGKEYPERTTAQHDEALRWSYCDSEYHGKLPTLMKSEACLPTTGTSAFDSLTDEEFDERCDTTRACCVEALQTLDARRVFGRGEDRSRLVLNVVMGDMSDECWDMGLRQMNPSDVVQRYSRLGRVRVLATARTEPLSVEEQAVYWVAQHTECAERGLQWPQRTSDGFNPSDIERELANLGEVAVPSIVREIARCVYEPDSFASRSRRDHGPMERSPAIRAFGVVWILGRIGAADDVSIDRLIKVLGHLVERDDERDWTETSAENLARTLHALRPDRFPASVLDPESNHLRNPSDFLA